MKQLISILILFFFVQTVSAYNPIWVHIDKKTIKSIVILEKNNPQSVEQYFRIQTIKICGDTIKKNLGFGWTMWESGMGVGYISISATFYYYNDSIISYTITPEMPVEKGLIKRYKAWYNNSFIFELNEILPFTYNSEQILRPLNEYKGTLTRQTVSLKISAYMTPNSGTIYGYAGGYSGKILENRKAFIEIKDSLTNEQVVFLMYSINPVSRLTAIEYYMKHKDNFSNQQTLDEWVEINFKEIPTVQTLFGCMHESYDTRTLVEMYSLMEITN